MVKKLRNEQNVFDRLTNDALKRKLMFQGSKSKFNSNKSE